MEKNKKVFEKLSQKIIDYYKNIRKLDVLPIINEPMAIRKLLSEKYSFKEGQSLENLVADIADMLEKGIVHNTHPRYFGLFNPSVDENSIAADMLVSGYNPQLAVWSQAPVAQEIERHILQLFLKKFGFSTQTGFANFTSGGAEANHSAVLCALTSKIHDYDHLGLSGKAKPIIYVSEEAHDSFAKIAHFTGIGRNHVRKISVDDNLQMNAHELKNQIGLDISNGFLPVMVAATAGTTSAGIIDPLDEIAEACNHYNVWFHVDAAWGGAAVFSPRLKKLLKGIEKADSITCDAHKWFSVAMGSGMFFCNHVEIVKKTFRIKTAYMPNITNNTFDPYSSTLQWSRRFIGLKLFMLFANLGIEGVSKRIEHQAEIGEILRLKLKEAGFTIVNQTKLPVVCFVNSELNTEKEIDSLITEIYANKKVWISKIALSNGNIALRACITSHLTNENDLDFLITEIKKFLAG